MDINEKYITEDYETGTAIDEFASYAEAMAAVAKYEATDRENDSYSEGFYAIRHGEEVERIYDAQENISRAKRLIHSLMGSATSQRKAAASRANGAKGGRPRKRAEQ